MAFETAPMPPRTKPHKSANAVYAAHAVVQQNVGCAGGARAAVGSDDAVGGERHFDFFALEPVVQKIRGALREDFHQADDFGCATGRAGVPSALDIR